MDYQTTHHPIFINGIFGAFFRSVADYFRSEWFNRTQDIVISTYAKSVETIRKRKNNSGEPWTPKFPFITFDPSMDFAPDDQAGRFFHGYPIYHGYSKRLASKLHGPTIYNDGNVQIDPVLNRYTGTFEMIIWCSSFYELMDYQVLTFQQFGGLNRPIYPRHIDTYLVLPDEVTFYNYNNPYLASTDPENNYQLDWTNVDNSKVALIKNINQNKQVYQAAIRPYIKLVSVSDGSEKYGSSTDDISEHRLSITMQWECSLPVYLVLTANMWPTPYHDVRFDINVGVYTKATPVDEPVFIPDEFLTFYYDGTDKTNRDLYYKETFNYIITAQDVENISNDINVTIPLPYELPDVVFLKVLGKYGLMRDELHWKKTDDSFVSFDSVDLVYVNMKELVEGDVITLVIYQEADDE